MNVDRSPIWIGLADLLLCVLSVIVAVAPMNAKVDGIKPKAQFPIPATGPSRSIPMSTFGSLSRRSSRSLMPTGASEAMKGMVSRV
jgi:hypothetical protein